MALRRAGMAAAGLITAALLIGCGGDDDPLADTESIDSSSPEGGQGGDGDQGGNGGESTGAGSDAEPGDGGGDGDVLGSSEASHPASAIDSRMVPLRVDVVRLDRNGDLVEVSLDLTNEAEPAEGDTDPVEFTPHNLFSPGTSEYDTSGLALVDGEGQKQYLPVVDSEGTCLCTDVNSLYLPAGDTFRITATVGGVPDDVEQIDVRLPGFPTITQVAIG